MYNSFSMFKKILRKQHLNLGIRVQNYTIMIDQDSVRKLAHLLKLFGRVLDL